MSVTYFNALTEVVFLAGISASWWSSASSGRSWRLPFGPFVSILGILDGAVATGRMAVVWGFLALLMLVFVGMGATVLKMLQGGEPDDKPLGEPRLTVVPVALLMICVLLLGLAIPSPVASLIRDAAAFLEVRP